MKALRLPAPAFPVAYLLRFQVPRGPPVSCSPRRSREAGGSLPGQGHFGQPADPISGDHHRGHERDLSGSQAIHPVPLPRSKTPAGPTGPRHWRSHRCCPRTQYDEGSSGTLYRGYCAASAPAAYASRRLLPAAMQGSLPAGWLAFTGRESNPLDRDERFQAIYISSSLPGLS
jgi:hypothetical protein